MGRERDYFGEYDRDKERYPEFIGGSTKLEKPLPKRRESRPAIPPPPGYYVPGTIQKEAEQSGNRYYLTPEELLAEEEPIEKYRQLGITGYEVTPPADRSQYKKAPPENKGFFGRLFGGDKDLSQPKQVATHPKKEEAQQPTPFNRTNKTETEPGSSGIFVNTQASVAVPGTHATYSYDFGNQIKPAEGVTYRWKVINDPAVVAQLRQKGEYIPHHIDGGETTSATFTGEEWSYTGQHTIEVDVYYHGKLIDSDRHTQVVRDASTLAREQFESSSPTGLQPDVYIGQLQLQKQIAIGNGATKKELKKIDRAINNAEKLLGVTEETPEGTAIPLKATLVPTADPTAVPLQLYLKPTKNGGWAIVDLTNPDPGQARTYSGNIKRGGRQADKVEGEAARKLAIDRAWDNYVRNNPHPAGELVADLTTGNKDGSSNVKQAHSDGVSELGKVRNWASRVGLVSGVVGIGLLVTPGAQGAGALLLGSAAAVGVAGGSGLLDRQKHGNLEWNSETFLDITDIAGGLAVGAGSAIRIGAKSATISQLGKNTVLISQGVETGTDVAAGTIISATHYRRISEIRNSDLPEGEKKAQISKELTLASATGGLILLGGVTTGRAGRAGRGSKGDFLNVSPDGIGTSAKPGKNGIRITPENLEEFRSIGFSKADLNKLNDPTITKAEKNALYARRDANYKKLYQAYGQDGIEQLTQKLGAKGLRQIYGATGNRGLKKVQQIMELEKQGKVKGFDDWIDFLNSGNRGDESIAEVVGELDVTKGVSQNLSKNEIINVGGDGQVVKNEKGERPKSLDLTVENKQTGEVLRNIEVQTPRDKPLATDDKDFRSGIKHAIDKATIKVKDAKGRTVIDPDTDNAQRIPNKDIKGDVEAAINVDIPKAGTVVEMKDGTERHFGESATYTSYNPKTKTSTQTSATDFDGEKDLYQDILDEQLSGNKDAEKYLDRVNIIDRDGTLRATIEKLGTEQTGYSWTVKRHR